MGLEALGLNTGMYPAGLVDSCKGKRLVICGPGRCVWDDLKQHLDRRHTQGWEFMVVNDIGMHFPITFHHWYSNDYRMLPKWAEARRPQYKMHDKNSGHSFKLHCCQHGDSRINHWHFPCHGTSGLNAVYTGIALGYDAIVLCGIPLDNSGHYFDPPWVITNFVNEVPERKGTPRYWTDACRNVFAGKVKSYSGRTRQLCGAPPDG